MKTHELYLQSKPGEVIQVDELIDTTCGIYPFYYVPNAEGFLVATTVSALLWALPGFELNSEFIPPDYMAACHEKGDRKTQISTKILGCQRQHPWLRRKMVSAAYRGARLCEGAISYMRGTDRHSGRSIKNYYENCDTIDRRIHRMPAFSLLSKGSCIDNTPNYTSNLDRSSVVTEASKLIQEYVTDIEHRFPDMQHVVSVGGVDSQLILLARKLRPKAWNVFSSHPNAPLVRRWLEENAIIYSQFFEHDNVNEETTSDFERKVLLTDLFTSPLHLRWLPTLRRISESFDKKVIFWSGTAGDAIFAYHDQFHGPGISWLDQHRFRCAYFQGTCHQVFYNFVGSPLLSPYHDENLWNQVILRMRDCLEKGNDLRREIGELLFRGKVKWLTDNPSPPPYNYSKTKDLRKLYLQILGKSKKILPGLNA